MIRMGRRLSNATIAELIREGKYCLTLEEALAEYGANIIVVQPIPREVLQYISPSEGSNGISLMKGLYVPDS